MSLVSISKEWHRCFRVEIFVKKNRQKNDGRCHFISTQLSKPPHRLQQIFCIFVQRGFFVPRLIDSGLTSVCQFLQFHSAARRLFKLFETEQFWSRFTYRPGVLSPRERESDALHFSPSLRRLTSLPWVVVVVGIIKNMARNKLVPITIQEQWYFSINPLLHKMILY